MSMIKFLNEIKEPKVSELGGKGYSLAVLVNNGFNVPKGFVITSDAFFGFLRENGIIDIIRKLISGINENNYREGSKELKNLILKGNISEQILQEIGEALRKLNKDILSIRSSAISEDSPKESFAGLHDSFIGVKRELSSVSSAIKKCWASLFNERSLIYRLQKNISLLDGMAIVVQELINSDVSGIVFTQHPLYKNNILIESSYGLGTLIVGGEITPDSFSISRKDLLIMDASISNKNKMCKINEIGYVEVIEVPSNKKYIPSLSTKYIRELSKISLSIENLFREPQDIEWCMHNEKIYIVQSRPVTTQFSDKKTLQSEEPKIDTKNVQMLMGVPASPGRVKGTVKIVKNEIDLGKIKDGEIVVTQRVTPKILSIVNKISGIISEEGSIISHAAIVAREFMVPCVVGIKKVTQILNDNIEVLLDGTVGKIFILNPKINVNIFLQKEQRTELKISKIQRKIVNLPRLEELADLNKLVEEGKIVLSPMGKRVVQTPNFADKWRNFILSLKPEKIIESWRNELGSFLSFLVKLVNINDREISVSLLDELVEIHNNFYMYNLLADCYDAYPLFRQIVEKYTIPHLDPKIIENLIDYSIIYEIPYNELESSIYIPLPSLYIPIGMHRTDEVSYRSILIELGKANALDRRRYTDILTKLEKGKIDELGLRVEIPKVERNLKMLAYEIFLNVLKDEERENFRLCVELIEHFGIMNDINRFVGKEFAQEAKRAVDVLKQQFNIDLESDWPWEQLLELYKRLHTGRYRIEREQ